jgi:hypothetical protein
VIQPLLDCRDTARRIRPCPDRRCMPPGPARISSMAHQKLPRQLRFRTGVLLRIERIPNPELPYGGRHQSHEPERPFWRNGAGQIGGLPPDHRARQVGREAFPGACRSGQRTHFAVRERLASGTGRPRERRHRSAKGHWGGLGPWHPRRRGESRRRLPSPGQGGFHPRHRGALPACGGGSREGAHALLCGRCVYPGRPSDCPAAAAVMEQPGRREETAIFSDRRIGRIFRESKLSN